MEWEACFQEAAHKDSPSLLRKLFVHICTHNNPISPLRLWNLAILETDLLLHHFMSQDFCRCRLLRPSNSDINSGDIDNCLYTIDDLLKDSSNGSVTIAKLGLPVPAGIRQVIENNRVLLAETSYNSGAMTAFYENCKSSMNPEQISALAKFNTALENNHQKLFFLNAPGGTGKSFLLNAILANWRSKGFVCPATGSSGISAILLQGGKTCHSMFGIPILCYDDAVSSITKISNVGKMLILSKLIIWDEVSMSSKPNLKCVDKLFRYVMDKDVPFGGKVVIFSGDFRQNLPVLKKANAVEIYKNTLKFCDFWAHVETISLTINERVRRNGDSERDKEFTKFLLNIGDGEIPVCKAITPNSINIPPEFIWKSSTLSAFVDWVYPQIAVGLEMDDRAILAPLNKDVDEINDIGIDKLYGEEVILTSSDTIKDDSQNLSMTYNMEYLNSINIPGLPPHILKLKIRAPVLLLRNLDPLAGLCNGTRLQIVSISRRLLYVCIKNGSRSGDFAWIPRIDLLSEPMPFILSRRQFPIRLAFGMTINKSQGQSLGRVGILLRAPVFGHGQLYTAFSRAQKRDCIKIHIVDTPNVQGEFKRNAEKRILAGTYTDNVVFKNIFLSI